MTAVTPTLSPLCIIGTRVYTHTRMYDCRIACTCEWVIKWGRAMHVKFRSLPTRGEIIRRCSWKLRSSGNLQFHSEFRYDMIERTLDRYVYCDFTRYFRYFTDTLHSKYLICAANPCNNAIVSWIHYKNNNIEEDSCCI